MTEVPLNVHILLKFQRKIGLTYGLLILAMLISSALQIHRHMFILGIYVAN